MVIGSFRGHIECHMNVPCHIFKIRIKKKEKKKELAYQNMFLDGRIRVKWILIPSEIPKINMMCKLL